MNTKSQRGGRRSGAGRPRAVSDGVRVSVVLSGDQCQQVDSAIGGASRADTIRLLLAAGLAELPRLASEAESAGVELRELLRSR